MKEWTDFRDECPKSGDIIDWKHCQAFLCEDYKKGDAIERIIFDGMVEWIEGDLWRKVR